MPRFTIPFRVQLARPMLIRDAAANLPGFDNLAVLRGKEPPVPQSSITGLVKNAIREFLRDASPTWKEVAACEGQASGDPVAPYCHGEGDESCPMCRVFGAPGGQRRGIEFSGAHYAEGDLTLLEALADESGQGEPQGFALSRRGRHKRDERYRRAMDDHLWVEGAAVAPFDLLGVATESPEHARLAEPARDMDRCLVILGMRLVRSIGAHRTKDFGRCEFLARSEDDGTWDAALKKIRDEWKRAKDAMGGGVS